MRFYAILFTTVATLCVSTAQAAECELTSTMQLLKKIEQNPSVEQCGNGAGFSLNPPAGKPTAAQLEKICASSMCQQAIDSLSAMKLPSCTISMFNSVNIRDIVDGIGAYCQSRPVVANEPRAIVVSAASDLRSSSSANASPSGVTLSTANQGKASLRKSKNCHS